MLELNKTEGVVLTKETVNYVANDIANEVIKNKNLFVNIQMPIECSQFDIMFSIDPIDVGRHQRGVRGTDLYVGIVGLGFYGFDIKDIPYLSNEYIRGKLGVGMDVLTKLISMVISNISMNGENSTFGKVLCL